MATRIQDPWVDNPTSTLATRYYSSSHQCDAQSQTSTQKANISRHRARIHALKESPARKSHAESMHALFTSARSMDKDSEVLTTHMNLPVAYRDDRFEIYDTPELSTEFWSVKGSTFHELPKLDIAAAQAASNDSSSEDWTGDDEFFPLRKQNTAETTHTYGSSVFAMMRPSPDTDATDMSDTGSIQKPLRPRRKVMISQPQTPISKSNAAYDGDVEDGEEPLTPLSPDVEIHRGSARHRSSRKKKRSHT